MDCNLGKFLLVGLLSVTPFGCDSRPVVVTPEADRDSTIIKDRDLEIDRDNLPMSSPEPEADVKVDVGGGRGIEVDVDRDTTE